MRSIESKAKTMEEAVTLGLEKLGVSFEDVNIDILEKLNAAAANRRKD